YEAPDGQTYTESGDYEAVISSTAGCDSTISISLTIVEVDAGLTYEEGTLTATAADASYQWLDCLNGHAAIDGETGQSYAPAANGEYAVEVTQDGCADTSACETVLITTITDAQQQGLSIFPNPTA